MSRNLSFALLASASFLCMGARPATAFDGGAGQPNVVYANDPQVTAVRSNMGGGFVQFLFGDTPQSRRYYEQQPQGTYQQQPSYYVPQGAVQGQAPMSPEDAETYAAMQRPVDPKFD